MTRVFSFLLILLFTFSCVPEGPGPIVDGGSNSITPQEGNIVIDLTIKLPPAAILNEIDLSVSSILTGESKQTAVEIFDEDGLELIFVTDKEQNIVLFGYVNPKNPSTYNIDASSTAQALLLMHPWSMDLSLDLKKQVLTEVLDLPEYDALKEKIEVEISKEKIDLLNNVEVLSSLELLIAKVLQSDSGKKSKKLIDELKEPLNISTTGNTLTVKNINNSMSYGVRLLGEKGTSSVKILQDVDKNLFSLDQLGRIVTLNGFKEREVKFDIGNNQQYSVIAKNGLVFDGSEENNLVFNRNAGKIVINLLGIVSSSLKGIFSSDECLDELGKYAYQNISETFLKISNNQISNNDFLNDNLDLLKDNTVEVSNVLKTCGSSLVKAEKLQTLITSVVKVKEVFDAVEFGLLIVDWARYDNEIEFCFDKSTGDALACDEVTLTGDLVFKKVPIGKPQTRTLTVRNNGLQPFTIKEFKYPAEDFVSEPLIEDGLLLNDGESLDFTITFKPETIKEYSGELEVITDADSGNAKIDVNAKGVIALKSDLTELNFAKLLVGESSAPQIIVLRNDSDVNIVISEAAPVEGYIFDIPEQTIPAGQSVSIEIVFKPTNDFEDYNKSLLFKTDTDQEDLVIELKGNGFKGLNLEVLSMPTNLDFGQVSTDSEMGETKLLKLSNQTDISIFLNGFLFTGEAEGGYTTSLDEELGNNNELTAGATIEFSITFKPDRQGFFNGDFIIENTESQNAPVILPISGEGVLNQLSVSNDFIDFGEVEEGGQPSIRTFEVTNNLDEIARITMIPDNDEVTTDWNNGQELLVGESKTVTTTFNPTSTTTIINGSIIIEDIGLNESINVNYTGAKKVGDQNILDGNWIPTWEVTTCEPKPTSNDQSCQNHQNLRPYLFIANQNGNCPQQACGIMDFSNIKQGNTDGVIINKWQFDGTTITIEILSNSSSGFFFNSRTFNFTGTLDTNTNTIKGTYESEYSGGLWRNKASGNLTLTRE